jgi:DNA polymerase-1
LALWAFTKKWGITDWRGSQFTLPSGAKFVPTYHPAAILRQYSWRFAGVHDLRRAAKWLVSDEKAPAYRFLSRPSLWEVLRYLEFLRGCADAGPLTLAVDIETRWGHIACLGLGWSELDALCIPFMCIERPEGYWTLEDEARILLSLSQLLQHPNVQCVGQNFLYDVQYIYRHWHFLPRFHSDTMLAHHVCWPGLPKGLDFLSSLYCSFHMFWKAEGKDWHKSMQEDILWVYNCKDCVITFEAHEAIQATVKFLRLEGPLAQQMELWACALAAMLRGLRVNSARREQVRGEIREAVSKRVGEMEVVLGHPINIKSPDQMKRLLYEDLQLRPIIDRKTGRPTTNDEALKKLAIREPLITPLLDRVRELRSLGVFLSTFVEASPDPYDGRMRCYFNPAGTDTFRLSSAEDAFGSGMNLQNVPSGDEVGLLPNIRKLFLADPGKIFFDMDLDRADLQVLVWEINDAALKTVLREGIDVHCFNAVDIFNIKGIPQDELKETHPNYKDHRARIGYKRRHSAKEGCHAVNYYCQPRTLAATMGTTVREAEQFTTRWLGAHPGIPEWHDRTRNALRAKRTVYNRFGYRRFFFDRVEEVLPEALAWVPQSTVACVINRVWIRIEQSLPEVEVLLQVHDSLGGQFPFEGATSTIGKLRALSKVTIPYEDPLVIPAGIKTSQQSWGDCS